jgi:hypothetical protein
MNFEHNHISLRKVALCLHRARQVIRSADDPEAAEFERNDLRGAIRQITDNTGSIFVEGKVGKYRNFRYWTKDALAAAESGEPVTRVFTGEHAIEVDMLARHFVEAVRAGEVGSVEAAAEWLAGKITIVTMTNEERRRHRIDRRHAMAWEELVNDPFARYPRELREAIVDRHAADQANARVLPAR